MKVFILRHKRNIGKYFTEEDYVKSSKREHDTANEIHRLSNGKINVEFVGYGAGVPEKFKTPKPHDADTPLDLEIKIAEKPVATVEVMGSPGYTFEKSGFFPVAWDKVERSKKSKIPVYFVFVLDDEEQPNQWWIEADRCDKYDFKPDFPTKYGPQDIYATNQHHWHRGLQTLIDELLKIV